MNDEQVKEFKSKLPEALPGCEVRFWMDDGLFICVEVRRGQSKPRSGRFDVKLMNSSHDVEKTVRGIVSDLPASWIA